MRRVLDRLERAGDVTRERDTSDRRRLVVKRTAAGEQAYRGANVANVANRLDDPEAFRRLLVQLVAGLLAARGEGVPDSLLPAAPNRPATTC